MTKKTGTKAKITKTSRSPSSGGETRMDVAAELSRDVYEDIVQIIRLQNKGVPRRRILCHLGISRSTYHRRMKLARELVSANPERAAEAVHAEIGETINFYEMIKAEAMKTTGLLEELLKTDDSDPVDPIVKLKGFEIASKAQDNLLKFYKSIGFFDTYTAEQKIKADTMPKEHVDIAMQENEFQLMEENQKLRENLEAARRGEPEPHGNNLQNWQSIFSRPNSDTNETSEADTDFEDFSLIH